MCLPREDPRAEMAAISEETFSQAVSSKHFFVQYDCCFVPKTFFALFCNIRCIAFMNDNLHTNVYEDKSLCFTV